MRSGAGAGALSAVSCTIVAVSLMPKSLPDHVGPQFLERGGMAVALRAGVEFKPAVEASAAASGSEDLVDQPVGTSIQAGVLGQQRLDLAGDRREPVRYLFQHRARHRLTHDVGSGSALAGCRHPCRYRGARG